MNKTNPPKLPLRFFRWFCHPDLRDSIEGDLRELYGERVGEIGKRKADWKFAVDVLLLFRPGIVKNMEVYQPVNQNGMFQSYFKIGWRNLLRNKGYSLINIGGLALGMAVAMLIGLWIVDELSFNRYHTNYHHIAKVMVSGSNSSGPWVQSNTSPPFAKEIRNLYDEDLKHVLMASHLVNRTVGIENATLVKRGQYFESGIVDMLSLNMLHGSYSGFNTTESILLSASLAKELFGDADPIGKFVTLENKSDVIITGVYEDIPDNSEFNEVLWIAPWDLYVSNNPWIKQDDWRQNGFLTFVQLADHADLEKVSHKIKDLKLIHVDSEEAKSKPQLFLHPMPKWRLYSGFEGNAGRIQFIWLYGCIGILVLILACINFMNLSTARAEKRAKEVGIRKSIGSMRFQLISQFLSESLLVAGLAFFISILLTQLALPLFSQIADKNIVIPWMNIYFWSGGILFVIISGLLAGSYPALYLSSFQPIKVLKGRVASGRSSIAPRKVLVVFQFTISIILIVWVAVIFRQIETGKTRSVGYEGNRLIWVNAYSGEIHKHIDAIRNELKQSGAITEISESVNTVTNIGFRFGGYQWPEMVPGTEAAFATAWVSHEFGNTVGWEIIDGRDFSRDFANDSTGMILNEAAAKFMNLKNPVGKTIKLTLFDQTTSFTVLGVVKNMLQESPYDPVQKTIYMIDNSGSGSVVNIKLSPTESISNSLAKIEKVFKKFDPASPFDYNFVEEAFFKKFQEEELIGRLAFLFAGLAILISSLGIFGLASFVAEQRTNEIGIRKILGASVVNVWKMLSKDFIILVAISCSIAFPVAYYFVDNWLQQFEIRTKLAWFIFVLAGISLLVITLTIVSYHTIRAAVANPVKSLRSE